MVGRKRWTLFPPSQTPFLRHASIRDRYVSDVRAVDASEFPAFARASPILLEQGPGETLFVPSGWHHFVENLVRPRHFPCASAGFVSAPSPGDGGTTCGRWGTWGTREAGGYHLHQPQLGQRLQRRLDVGEPPGRLDTCPPGLVGHTYPCPRPHYAGSPTKPQHLTAAPGRATCGGPRRPDLAHLRTPDMPLAEWDALCEQVLRANSGMGTADFAAYLRHGFQGLVLAAPAGAGRAGARMERRLSQPEEADRRQWALQQLLKVLRSMQGARAAESYVLALHTDVLDAAIRAGWGVDVSAQPPRATLDLISGT